MLLLLVRHGESTFNALGKLAGQADVPLSDNGQRQVAALAPIVARYRPDMAVSSDLLRTRQTADLLGHAEALVWPELREMDLGEWTSAEVAALQAEQPDQYAAWRAGELTPPGGEDWATFCARVGGALARGATAGVDCLLMVVHGGVIRAACDLLIDLPASRIAPVNPASLTVFEGGARPRLVAYNTGADTGVVAAHQ